VIDFSYRYLSSIDRKFAARSVPIYTCDTKVKRQSMNEAQKRAALALLMGAKRRQKESRDNRAKYLRHHLGWLVTAIVGNATEIDLFATKQAADAAVKVLRKFRAEDVQCTEASFTADEYDLVMGD
jgi:hypothetical protein